MSLEDVSPDRHALAGLVGVFGDPEAVHRLGRGLVTLAHRGQGGWGVAWSDGQRLREARDRRSPRAVPEALRRLPLTHGSAAVGQVSAALTSETLRPLVRRVHGEEIAVAQDGRFTNSARLVRSLEAAGALFTTGSQTEILMHLLARSPLGTLVNRLVDALQQLDGGYGLLVLSRDRLIAVRDPLGLRPLVLGRSGGGYVVASETSALAAFGARLVREVEPGEMLIFEPSEFVALHPFARRAPRPCLMERVHIAREDAQIGGGSAWLARRRAGATLAKDSPADADIVVPIPEAGFGVAEGYAAAAELPMVLGLRRLRPALRLLTRPGEPASELELRGHFAVIAEAVRDQRVVVVDDCIGRGFTARAVIDMLRVAGADEVHLRVASPPLRFGCPYGVTLPSQDELLSQRTEPDQAAATLGADSFAGLSLQQLVSAQGAYQSGFCDACFSGRFPLPVEDTQDEPQLALFRKGEGSEL